MIWTMAWLAHSEEAGCIDRGTAVGRAMEWVRDGVPYNAGAYHDGYVQGCEGIVGYGWDFPKPGIPSGELEGRVCTRINKGQLEKGDLMVHPNSHQLIFDSWSRDGYYIAVELSPSGSQRHEVKYPYWDSNEPDKYFPCKVNKACSTPRIH
jgi:hypothetical protein